MSDVLDIDLQAAVRFLAALSPDTAYTFQTFDDAKGGRKGLSRILHGTLAANGEQLAELNRHGAGVFVMVNRGDGKGRKAENVIDCRALFLDLDGSPIEPVLAAPIPPRIVVESSPGRWHAYWPTTDLPTNRFTAAQKALAALYAGDPKVHDMPRVMRMPGFFHRKGAPFVSRLVTCEGIPPTWQEMADAFELPQRMTLPKIINQGERNSTLFKLARSAATKGVPEQAQLDKALQVNAKRCEPPLPEVEVRAVVTSAYKVPQAGTATIPLAVLDSLQYKALDDGARTLLLLAYRRLDRFKDEKITLPWSECRSWFPMKNRFQRMRRKLTESGLITVVQKPVVAMPRKGRGPQPTFYKVAIGAKTVPYSPAE